MTKKDFFRILIKVLGFILLMNTIPILFSQLSMISSLDNDFTFFWIILIATLTSIALCCWLIFCPDFLVNLFKLDKGYDDQEVKISDLNTEKITSIAVIIVGGLFLINSFAPLLVEIVQSIYDAVSSNQSLIPMLGYSDNTRLFVDLLNSIIGIFILFNFKNISRYLVKKNKKTIE